MLIVKEINFLILQKLECPQKPDQSGGNLPGSRTASKLQHGWLGMKEPNMVQEPSALLLFGNI